MNLYLKRSSLADVRLELFTEMEARLAADFLELMELRERLREAELSADLKSKTRARKPALRLFRQRPSLYDQDVVRIDRDSGLHAGHAGHGREAAHAAGRRVRHGSRDCSLRVRDAA